MDRFNKMEIEVGEMKKAFVEESNRSAEEIKKLLADYRVPNVKILAAAEQGSKPVPRLHLAAEGGISKVPEEEREQMAKDILEGEAHEF